MQQFTVPQFIDVEDKIIGPITARQFIIMLTGSLLVAICYKLFDFTLFLSLGVIIMAICGVLAFFKVNGMPFHFFILNFFQTLARPGLRIWDNMAVQQNLSVAVKKNDIKNISSMPPIKKTGNASRLSELSLIVDTRGAFRGETAAEGKLFPGEEASGKT